MSPRAVAATSRLYGSSMPHDPFVETALGPLSPTPEEAIVGWLRRAVGGLTKLMDSPSHPRDDHHLAAALHAVHRALIELEPLANRSTDPGPRPLA